MTVTSISVENYSIESMLAGVPPQKEDVRCSLKRLFVVAALMRLSQTQDVQHLFTFLSKTDSDEEVVKAALEIVSNLHKYHHVQEHLVEALLWVCPSDSFKLLATTLISQPSM